MGHVVMASQIAAGPIEEDEEEVDEEVDMGEGSSTADLVPKQVPASWAAMPVVPGFWAAGPIYQVARKSLTADLRAQGKVPAIQAELLPQPRQTKSWRASSRQSWWQRRLAREEMQLPLR